MGTLFSSAKPELEPTTPLLKKPKQQEVGMEARDLVLLTVPHAMCPQLDEDHLCDVIAEKAARLLGDALLRRRGGWKPRVEIMLGDVVRSEAESSGRCDLNRIQCRSKAWRQLVRSRLPFTFTLLDVHSFPAGQSSFSTPQMSEPELVLLDNDPSSGNSVQLAAKLSASGIKLNVFQGAQNDVAIEAISLRVPKVFLLEFNESLHLDRLVLITQTIANHL